MITRCCFDIHNYHGAIVGVIVMPVGAIHDLPLRAWFDGAAGAPFSGGCHKVTDRRATELSH